MEETTASKTTTAQPKSSGTMPISRSRSRDAGARTSQPLAAPADTRERLVALYRERDEMDAVGYATGSLKMRGTTYAIGLARLESGEETYESYGVIAAAGVKLPPATLSVIAALPQDWSRICRIDSEGNLWTASVREKQKLVR